MCDTDRLLTDNGCCAKEEEEKEEEQEEEKEKEEEEQEEEEEFIMNIQYPLPVVIRFEPKARTAFY